ncbi:hypothetical protein EMCRGX_G012996 [Ephydatia muelleri]
MGLAIQLTSHPDEEAYSAGSLEWKRAGTVSDSATLTLWLNGPEWLHTDTECEPSEVMPEEFLAEMKNLTSIEAQALLTAECNIITPLLRCEDFSTLKRLLRTTGYRNGGYASKDQF